MLSLIADWKSQLKYSLIRYNFLKTPSYKEDLKAKKGGRMAEDEMGR